VTLTVRAASPDDAVAIHAVHAAAFGRDAEGDLVDALVAGGHAAYSYVAVGDGTVVGHALLSRITVGGDEALALAPVGVVPEVQGNGVGSAVVRAALDAATADGARLVLVLGDPAYYSRFGFTRADEHGIETPEGWPPAHFQALLLGGAPPQGRPAYPPPFDDLPDQR